MNTLYCGDCCVYAGDGISSISFIHVLSLAKINIFLSGEHRDKKKMDDQISFGSKITS